MKNNFLIIIILSLYNFSNAAVADSFTLQSKKIEMLESKNQITAYEGKAISNNKDIEIKSDKFIYLKEEDILKSFGNGEALINSEKIMIKFDEAFFDQKNQNIKAYGNIEIYQIDNNFLIQNDEIIYDQKNNIISSSKTTKLEDNRGNIHFVDSFVFEINKDVVKVENLITKDNQSNTYKTSIAFLNIKSGKVFGKDIKVELVNPSNIDQDIYRLKGNSIKINEESSEITKGIFTTCQKRDSCPPWAFSAKSIKHDKKKKEISYNDALLKIYDIPIAYFPKFFHPDPTVKRKSGFLIPSIKNASNSDNFLNVPFFYAVADNKDFTFTPRLYAKEKLLLQTEYRQKNQNSDHLFDFSILAEKSTNSKSHFFYKFDKTSVIENFESSEMDIKIQKTTNDKYLKSEKLETKITDENNILENSLSLDLYSNDLSINLNTTIYENLNKENNDRFEFILPRVLLTKNFNNINNLNGNFSFNSDISIRHYDTNILEKKNINDLIFISNRKINELGILNNHQFLLRNTNSENRNSKYKNKKNFFISSMYQFNSSLPLIKENNLYQNILKPKLALKVAPNHTKNERDIERKIDVTNIYSLDRVTDNSSVEGGLSLAYGVDYTMQNKLKNLEILNLKLANNLRINENDDLSNTNQIGEKTSNLFSEISFKPNDLLSFKYISSIKNNLKDVGYESMQSKLSMNNFVTTFDYLNENNTFTKNSYLSNTSIFNINESNNLEFSTRKNKTKDLTEYYKFMYQYKNDCLAASIEYNKDFYSDGEIKPDESIMFKLTITPFAEVSSPNVY